jgi:chromate reductase, NAD(P)H dehydrogenase (quinone)
MYIFISLFFQTQTQVFMKINIISTSPRKESNSLKVAKYLQKQFSKKENAVENVVLLNDFEACDVPNVGRGSLDKNKLTAFQKTLINHWQESELIVMVVPEYNWTTSAEIINLIHQIGNDDFKHLFNEKVFAFVGVSSGRGGRLPCLEMTTLVNKMISFTGQLSIVSPKLYESHETPKNLDADGNSLGNTIYENTMKDFTDYTLKIAQKWFSK